MTSTFKTRVVGASIALATYNAQAVRPTNNIAPNNAQAAIAEAFTANPDTTRITIPTDSIPSSSPYLDDQHNALIKHFYQDIMEEIKNNPQAQAERKEIMTKSYTLKNNDTTALHITRFANRANEHLSSELLTKFNEFIGNTTESPRFRRWSIISPAIRRDDTWTTDSSLMKPTHKTIDPQMLKDATNYTIPSANLSPEAQEIRRVSSIASSAFLMFHLVRDDRINTSNGIVLYKDAYNNIQYWLQQLIKKRWICIWVNDLIQAVQTNTPLAWYLPSDLLQSNTYQGSVQYIQNISMQFHWNTVTISRPNPLDPNKIITFTVTLQ